MTDRVLSHPTLPWLGEVMASAAAAVGVPLGTGEGFDFPAARSVILIVVDGLGWLPLEAHRGHVPALRPFFAEAKSVNTCLPSTTAAALTSLSTGALPGQSRMVGYSVAHGAGTMNLLNFSPEVDAEAWQPCSTYFERLQSTPVRPVVVSAPKFVGSGFTRASLRGAEFRGARTLGERFALAKRLAEEQPSLVYLYWAEVDHAGHGYGVDSDQWRAALEEFDNALGDFLRQPPRDTTVVLTADHGMIDVEQRIDLAQVPVLSEGVRLIAGEGRSVHVHALAGQEEQVRNRWRDYLGDRAVILEPRDYAAAIGSGPGTDLLGDAVAFLSGRDVVVDSRVQSPAMVALKGVHGSFTDEEMMVPVMVLG